MDTKPKAGKAKGPPRKASPKADKAQKTQSERFIETARAIGVDESGDRFERAMKRLVPQKRRA